VVPQSISDIDHLVIEVSRSHTVRYTQPVGLLWTSDQPVAEAVTCAKHNRPIYKLSAGLELAIPAVERLQTYALERTATGMGQQRYIARAYTRYRWCCYCKDLSFSIETYIIFV
jgi:hypothetical protein